MMVGFFILTVKKQKNSKIIKDIFFMADNCIEFDFFAEGQTFRKVGTQNYRSKSL